MIFFISLLVTGLIGGLLAGITGIGTGIVMIAIIPHALQHLGIPESEIVQFTIANTLFATMCSSFINNIQVFLKKEGHLRETLLLSISAALMAGIILQLVVFSAAYTTAVYNTIIVIIMLYIITRSLYKLKKNFSLVEHITIPKLLMTGACGGAVSALTGLGGASIIIPMLNLWMKVSIIKAKSIAYGTIFISSLIITILNTINQPIAEIEYSHLGFLIFPVALPLVIGVLIGSPVGLKVGDRFNPKTVSYIFLSILSLVMINKIIELVS